MTNNYMGRRQSFHLISFHSKNVRSPSQNLKFSYAHVKYFIKSAPHFKYHHCYYCSLKRRASS